MKKNSRKILIIDDDRGIIKTLEKWLTADGRTVISALNGKEGLNRAKMKLPDLILLDVMLPDIGVEEVVKGLKADPETQDIPIICITAYMGVEIDKGDERIEINGEWYRIFAKPLHNPKLLSEIRKAINRRIHNR